MLNSRGLTKLQVTLLISIILVAGLAAVATYVLLNRQDRSSETIKIGICADLDSTDGKAIWKGAVLAAEQINAGGGVLGRNFTIVAEDDDCETPPFDVAIANNALNRLINVDKVDFVVSEMPTLASLEIASQNRKILFSIITTMDEMAQRVLDDYDSYKYFFRTGIPNGTSAVDGTVESIVVCRELTGFNKIAFLYHEVVGPWDEVTEGLSNLGFDVVYTSSIPMDAVDFSSYFARAENAGAEIIYPAIAGPAGIAFVKEYYERQSPTVLWGFLITGSRNDFWNLTDGKCEYTTNNGYPVVVGYPLTTKTASTRDVYIERWDEEITNFAGTTFDTVRFILSEAIRRAGTIETEAVISALEKTEVETSMARRFVFTSSHDVFVGAAGPNRPAEDYFLVCLFQWQDGVQIPVYPLEIMQEAGATYKFPDWPGPWNT